MRMYKNILDELDAAKMRLQQATIPKMDRINDACSIDRIRDLEATVEELKLELLQAVRCKDCIHLKEIFCHPWNKDIGKGSIIDRLGWACAPPETGGKAIFFDNNQGRCELFEQKRK